MANLTTLALAQNLTIPSTTEGPIGKVLIQPQSLNLPDFITLFCAHSIINAHGSREAIFLYHFADNVVDMLKMESRMVCNLQQKFQHNKRVDFLVFVVDNVQVVRRYLDNNYYTKYFNPYAKILVIYRGSPQRLIELFDLFYSYRLLQLVVMTTDHKVYGSIVSCFNQFAHPKLLFNCQARNISSILKVYDLEIAVEGCNVKALALPMPPYVTLVNDVYTGIAVRILQEAAYAYNFNVEYVNHNKTTIGYQLPDPNRRRQTKEPTYTGLLGSLEKMEGDVAIGLISTNTTHPDDFAVTLEYLDSYYKFYTSKLTSMRQRDKTSQVFAADTLQAYFATIGCAIVLVIFFKMILIFFNADQFDGSYACLQLWGMCFARSVRQPRRTPARIIFLSWAFFTYIFTSSYESTLTSFLMQPPELKPVTTLDDIVRLKLRPIGSPLLKDVYFRSRDDPNFEIIYNRWDDCLDITTCLRKYYFHSNFALFVDSRYLNTVYKGYDSILDNIKAFHHYIWMVVNKGTGFEKLLTEVISRVTSTGILSKWVKDNTFTFSFTLYTSDAFESLMLRHYTALWWIFIGGISFSILVFILELGYFYGWYNKIKRRLIRHSN